MLLNRCKKVVGVKNCRVTAVPPPLQDLFISNYKLIDTLLSADLCCYFR